MHFTEYDTRLAAYALLVADGSMLLTWFNGGPGAPPCWTLPGGGVEFDESLEDGVVREVYEETGYVVTAGAILATHHLCVPATSGRRPMRSQRFVLAATITGGVLGTTEQGGTTDFARWVPLGEVGALPARAGIVDVALGLLER
ncbi:NUDIX hydrolase [Georgenia faecalis]|uniref:NUDIX hydrolase n=1 Tax=Georgenia faecalis TaxID=2483799 RepID=A0ABV9D9Q7_9MICO|nr:NUDIX domain-containing protein [Georgenia faecalis]